MTLADKPTDDSPSPDPDRWPTAKEWTDWFLRQSTERQHQIAQRVVADASAAVECLIAHPPRPAVSIAHPQAGGVA